MFLLNKRLESAHKEFKTNLIYCNKIEILLIPECHILVQNILNEKASSPPNTSGPLRPFNRLSLTNKKPTKTTSKEKSFTNKN